MMKFSSLLAPRVLLSLHLSFDSSDDFGTTFSVTFLCHNSQEMKISEFSIVLNEA